MAMNRTVKCDVCKKVEFTESEFGAGFPGWAILNGIAAVEPKEDEPLTEDNMKTYCCPECTKEITDHITELQTWKQGRGFIKEVK